MYNFLDTSIAQASDEIINKIVYQKVRSNERLDALKRNTKENLIALESTASRNDKKMLKTTLNSKNWISKKMGAVEVNSI